jgi:integrase/recombinase XerD
MTVTALERAAQIFVAVQALPVLPSAQADDRYSPRALTASWLDKFPSAHTRQGYFHDLVAYLYWSEVEGLDPLQARPVDAERYVTSLTGAARSKNRWIAAVSSWYKFLANNGACATNPFAAATRVKIDSDVSVSVDLTMADVGAILRVFLSRVDRARPGVERSRALRNLAVIQTLSDMGLRITEVIDLDLENLGYAAGRPTLHEYLTKGGVRRTRRLPFPTLDALNPYLEARGGGPGPLLATVRPDGSFGRLARQNLAATFKGAAWAAGIPFADRVSPHALRAAFIANARDLGYAPEDVQEAVGHADLRTTRGYDKRRRSLDSDPALGLADRYAEEARRW